MPYCWCNEKRMCIWNFFSGLATNRERQSLIIQFLKWKHPIFTHDGVYKHGKKHYNSKLSQTYRQSWWFETYRGSAIHAYCRDMALKCQSSQQGEEKFRCAEIEVWDESVWKTYKKVEIETKGMTSMSEWNIRGETRTERKNFKEEGWNCAEVWILAVNA